MCVWSLQVFYSLYVDTKFCDKAFCQDQKHGCQVSIAFLNFLQYFLIFIYTQKHHHCFLVSISLGFVTLLSTSLFVASHQLAALILYISNDYHIKHFPLNSALGHTVKEAWVGFVIFYTSSIPTLVQRVDILYKVVVFISMLNIHSVSHIK